MEYKNEDVKRLIYLVREVRTTAKAYHAACRDKSEKGKEGAQKIFRSLRHFETQLDKLMDESFPKIDGTNVVINETDSLSKLKHGNRNNSTLRHDL